MNDPQNHETRAAMTAARHKATQAAKEAAKLARLKAALRDNLRRRKVPRETGDGESD